MTEKKRAICVRCGKTRDEHFNPWKYPNEFYCSDDNRSMATYLELVGPATPPVALKDQASRNLHLSHAIRNLRKRTGLAQVAFAAKVEVGRSALGSYEEGRAEPPLEVIFRMTQAAGISMDLFCKTVFVRETKATEE